MIQSTHNKPIAELFSSDNKIRFHIPKYQREYVWSKWNWEALFDDLEESNGGHFLGSIICINTETDSAKPAALELVDGQQRMTTLSILYLALFKYLQDTLPASQEDQFKLMILRQRLLIGGSLSQIRLTPSMTNMNLEDYKYLMASVFDPNTVQSKPKHHGLRRMAKAYWYFFDRLSAKDESEVPRYQLSDVEAMLDKLNTATLVKIDVASHADAFTLFETLNNRGEPLSAIDLIKNKLLGTLQGPNAEHSIEEDFDRWNKILTNLTDNYQVQERFLRQFYNAFKHEEEIGVQRIPKALRSNLIRVYEELIERNVEKVFTRLEEASAIYSRNINPIEVEGASNQLTRTLKDLENVTGVDAYMLLLFIERRFHVGDAEKDKLVQLLCRYFIRRNITDTPPTRDLSNLFIAIIEKANELPSYSYEAMEAIILEHGRPASDDLFASKLHGDLYEENVGAVRYLLSAVENALSSTREIYTDFYARGAKNLYVWTVEHVLPQGDNMPTEWVQMIAGGDKAAARQVQKACVHKLGNLTLTGYNSQLSNMSFEKKRDRKDNSSKYIGYKNGLALNKVLADKQEWTKDDIEARTDVIVMKALEIFRLKHAMERVIGSRSYEGDHSGKSTESLRP